MRDPWFDSLNRPCGAQIALHFCMPNQVAQQPDKINVNFTMFEATRVPPNWIRENRKHHLLIVPAESSRRAWIDSGMPPHRIRLCPLGVNPLLFSGSAIPLTLRTENSVPVERYRVRFLNVSALSPRKNLFGLLEAWVQATQRNHDAVLILKLGCHAPGAKEQFVQGLEQRFGTRLADAAPIVFVYGAFPDTEMPRLYATATHYISMSCGEGWDQAMMEAAASGLKLIAPAHSAYNAYLDSSIASMIPSREVPAVYAGDAATAELFLDAHWWQPDQPEAIDRIRAAIAGHDNRLASPRDRILRDFTWQNATRRLIGILDELQPLAERLRIVSRFRRNNSGAAEISRSQPDSVQGAGQ